MIELMRGGAGYAKGAPIHRLPASSAAERHVVAMDHFGPTGSPKDMCDVARIASANALGVQGVIGDEAASDLDPGLVANCDAIATRENTLHACDPGREQALAAGQRPNGAG